MTASTKRPAHRPALPPDQRAEVRAIRLTDAHWAELQARGGVAALRAWLDKPKRAKA
jgi:hypothetical protein